MVSDRRNYSEVQRVDRILNTDLSYLLGTNPLTDKVATQDTVREFMQAGLPDVERVNELIAAALRGFTGGTDEWQSVVVENAQSLEDALAQQATADSFLGIYFSALVRSGGETYAEGTVATVDPRSRTVERWFVAGTGSGGGAIDYYEAPSLAALTMRMNQQAAAEAGLVVHFPVAITYAAATYPAGAVAYAPPRSRALTRWFLLPTPARIAADGGVTLGLFDSSIAGNMRAGDTPTVERPLNSIAELRALIGNQRNNAHPLWMVVEASFNGFIGSDQYQANAGDVWYMAPHWDGTTDKKPYRLYNLTDLGRKAGVAFNGMTVMQANGLPGIADTADIDGDYVAYLPSVKDAGARVDDDNVRISVLDNTDTAFQVHQASFAYGDGGARLIPFTIDPTEEGNARLQAAIATTPGFLRLGLDWFDGNVSTTDTVIYDLPISAGFVEPQGGSTVFDTDQIGSENVTLTDNWQAVETGITIPSDADYPWLLLNAGSITTGSRPGTDAAWVWVSTKQLRDLQAGAAGGALGDRRLVLHNPATATPSAVLFIGRTASYRLLIGSSDAAIDPMPLTVRGVASSRIVVDDAVRRYLEANPPPGGTDAEARRLARAAGTAADNAQTTADTAQTTAEAAGRQAVTNRDAIAGKQDALTPRDWAALADIQIRPAQINVDDFERTFELRYSQAAIGNVADQVWASVNIAGFTLVPRVRLDTAQTADVTLNQTQADTVIANVASEPTAPITITLYGQRDGGAALAPVHLDIAVVHNPPHDVQALASAAAIAWDVDAGEIADLTLGHNATLTMSGGANGDVAQLRVKQDSTGNRTLTLSGITANRPAPVLSTAADESDTLFFQRWGASWRYLGIIKDV